MGCSACTNMKWSPIDGNPYTKVKEFFKGELTTLSRVKNINDDFFIMKEIEKDLEGNFKNEKEIKKLFNKNRNIINEKKPLSNINYNIYEDCEKSLKDLIEEYNKNNNMDDSVIIIILRDISLLLKRLHSENIILLDIRPDKILIGKDDNNIKLTDISSSLILDSNDNYWPSDGSFNYYAPEIINYNTNIPIDKADIYSLGCFLYEFCENKAYNGGEIEVKSYEKIKDSQKKDKINIKNKKLEDLINNMLKEYKDRYDISQVCKKVNELYSKINIPKNIDELDPISQNFLKRLEKNEIKLKIEVASEINKEIYFFSEDKKKIGNIDIFIFKKDDLIKRIKNTKCFKFKESGVYKIKIEYRNDIEIENCEKMFSNCKNITNFNFNLFNTSKVTNMSQMFQNCIFKNIDLSPLVTSNVDNMEKMFYSCKNLEELDFSTLDTHNITKMNRIFSNCRNLKKINLSIDTKNVKDMGNMFENCENLENLNLSSFDTSNVTNMESMFFECKSLKKLDLSNFNTNKVEKMICMFNNCEQLRILDLSFFNTKKIIESKFVIFEGCNNLQIIIINKNDKLLYEQKIPPNCKVIDLKLKLAYKSFIDLFIFIFGLPDTGNFLNKIENIEKYLLEKKSRYTDNIKSFLNDIFDLIDKYDYDKINIDIKLEENIFSILINNIEKYKNKNYEQIKIIMKKFKLEVFFKQLVEIRENKFLNTFKKEENSVIENIKKNKYNNNGLKYLFNK